MASKLSFELKVQLLACLGAAGAAVCSFVKSKQRAETSMKKLVKAAETAAQKSTYLERTAWSRDQHAQLSREFMQFVRLLVSSWRCYRIARFGSECKHKAAQRSARLKLQGWQCSQHERSRSRHPSAVHARGRCSLLERHCSWRSSSTSLPANLQQVLQVREQD